MNNLKINLTTKILNSTKNEEFLPESDQSRQRVREKFESAGKYWREFDESPGKTF